MAYVPIVSAGPAFVILRRTDVAGPTMRKIDAWLLLRASDSKNFPMVWMVTRMVVTGRTRSESVRTVGAMISRH